MPACSGDREAILGPSKVSRLKAVKAFFVWLAGQPGYPGKLKRSDVEFFNASANELRIAGTTGYKRYRHFIADPHVLATMSTATPSMGETAP